MSKKKIVEFLQARIETLEEELERTRKTKRGEWFEGYTEGKIDGYKAVIEKMEGDPAW